MGLFDKVFGGLENTQGFGPHEGFAGVLLGASACDGHIADEEVQSLFTKLTRMKMFDLLIANIDRNQGNLIYDADWHLILIDHSRAFITKKDLKGIAPLGRVDRKLWEKMQALTLEELKMPKSIFELSTATRGMILVTGKTGSGKSTTLAAVIDAINAREKGHILTIEDPIEFVHQRKLCLISQREVGVHSPSFANALHSALREDPDAILVGELRDLETMSIAMTAAEMGVLVMGTLHTNGAAATIDRAVNIFPSDKQDHVRNMLSTSLRGIVSQQLIKKKDGTGRCVALEILINTSAAANLIRQGKLEQLENVMQSSGREGMITMDSSLKKLYDDGMITGQEAYLNAIDKSKFEQVKDN